MRIAVIGSGGWGTALALLCKKNGNDVCLWSYLKEESERLKKDGENKEFLPNVKLDPNIDFTSDIEYACKDAEIIVSAVPSFAVRSTSRLMKKYADGKIIVNVSKGFEESSLLRLSEVIKEELPNSIVAVMSGPSHAEEVAREIPTANVVACEDYKTSLLIQDVFMSNTFRVYTNSDVCGVEIGGALKNVIALCAGIIDGLGFGDNTKAALMTRGISEIAKLGKKMGAKEKTFSGLTGIGDLIVTCTSMHSRNRRAGILLGQGKSLAETLETVHMTVEGVNTTRAAYNLGKKYNIEMPIVNEAYAILFENKNAKDAVASLMGRGKKDESEEAFL